jgi:hypothetical protein
LIDLREEERQLIDAHSALVRAPVHADEIARAVSNAPGVSSSSFCIHHKFPPFLFLFLFFTHSIFFYISVSLL